jgi:putative NIF3 family GTP cyclohydrolase 1 type 2
MMLVAGERFYYRYQTRSKREPMPEISRRKFVALTATSIAAAPLALRASALGGAVTAQHVVDRIQKNLGIDWKPDTVDTFKAGDPATVVTGIVTTALASLDVLGRAVKAGANLIVTCEPTFYTHGDSPAPPVRRGFPGAAPATAPTPAVPDPVFSAKADFLRKHNLVVWRFNEHWRMRQPDPYAQGLGVALGWSKFADASDPTRFTIPETSLDALVLHVKKSLNARGGMRIVGDPRQRIRTVALLPGSTPIQASVAVLPQVDAILAGEVREWESVEYVRDTVALGGKKSMTLVGRMVSEEPGMQVCAQWLKTIVPEVAATFISAGDPYWRPTA